MKAKILQTATDLFLNYGFKSVTMDDIADNLGISKKTIYQHYKNKTKLVEATVMNTFDFINKNIDAICALNKNPIEEAYEIENFIQAHLKEEKTSSQYQLKKYYPKIFNTLYKMQFESITSCVSDNLSRGVTMNLYRADIDIDFIAKLFFNTMISLKNQELFPLKHYSVNTLMNNYLEYHLRAICTPKGIRILCNVINKQM
ncbi:MAG: TetR family transcriptional regulator [Flavobacteriales bacterium]|nr:MAG: TetR family transcriptional regulator [Flavobacteriales bacterium]